MKTYRVRYKDLYLEFELEDTATKKDMEDEFNRIIRDSQKLLVAYKRGMANEVERLQAMIEHYKKTANLYLDMYNSCRQQIEQYQKREYEKMKQEDDFIKIMLDLG